MTIPHDDAHDRHTRVDARSGQLGADSRPAPEGAGHDEHAAAASGLNRLAASSTMHCLTGCAIGEILGLILGTAIGLSTGKTIALAVGLAFLFGYALSILPLLKIGLALTTALSTVLAADSLSIATMEIVDNTVMAVIPGAMDAGLLNPVFWVAMTIALGAAFVAAYPVNRWLLQRGKGHALVHRFHHDAGTGAPDGWRRLIPGLRTSTLVAVILAFMGGGFTVALAEELTAPGDVGSQSEDHASDEHG